MARTFVQQSQISGSLAFNDTLEATEAALTSKPTLVGDLDALRSQVNKIIGKTNWFEALDGSQDLADIYAAVHMSGADAVFQGDISAVDGTFSGNVAAVDATLSGDLAAVDGTFSGNIAAVDATLSGDLAAVDGTFSGNVAAVDATLSGDLSAVDGSFSGNIGAVDASFSGAMDVGGIADFAADVYMAAALGVSGSLTVAGAADFNGNVTANKISIDNDVAGHLYFVDPITGEVQDSADLRYEASTLFVTGAVEISQGLNVLDGGLTVAGDKLEITGSFALLGDAAINGGMSVSGIVDLAGTLSASAIKIDGDVAQRLYIVGDDLALKDEAALTFDGSELWINGDLEVAGGDITMSNSMSISSATSGKLLLTGDVVETSADLRVAGNTIKSSTADAIELSGANVEVKGDLQVSGNDISDSGAATVLSFKTLDGADHSVEVANNMEVKGDMLRAVSGSFSGDLTVGGDLVVQGAMTYIDTENLKIKDALIHLNVGGSSNLMDRGIMFHGDAAFDDLGFGVKAGAGAAEFIFAKGVSAEAAIDGSNEAVLGSAGLASAWLGGVKLGGQEGSLSGSLAATAAGVELGSSAELSVTSVDDLRVEAGGNLMLTGSADLYLSANGEDQISFIGIGEYAAFDAQFPGMSLVAAIVAAGGNFKQDSFKPGVTTAGAAIDFEAAIGMALRSGIVGTPSAEKLAMDVYLNGVRLVLASDYSIESVSEISLEMGTTADDVLTIVVHNAAV